MLTGSGEMQYRIYDDELDLSFEDLVEVPMESIKSFSKVVTIDLSHNSIQHLPKDFPLCFENIMHLDLSYNCLSSLPETFGSLTNLRYLDLSYNNIRSVDVHFANLQNLESLNLKGNNLIPILKEVTAKQWGIDESYSCAKNIVTFMQQVDAIVNSTEYENVSPKQSIEIEDRKVEILFSRTNSNTNTGEGVLVEDPNGQCFYVTFGKVVKTPQIMENKSSDENENALSKTKILSQTEPTLSRTIRTAKIFVQTILFCTFLACFCTIFLSLTLYPENLKTILANIMDTEGRLVLNFLKLHSWILAKLQSTVIFPVSPPLKKPQGFLEWLGHSISSLFYTLFLNYSAK